MISRQLIPSLILTLGLSACSQRTGDQISLNAIETQLGATNLAEGQDRGNGADLHEFDDVGAWFQGVTRTVRYCIDRSSDFPLGDDFLEEKIQAALGTWVEFIRNSGNYYYQNRTLALLYSRGPCNGKEDLKFLFGKSTPELAPILANRKRSMAITHRISRDPKLNWSKGFIWFAPQGYITKQDARPHLPAVFPDWRVDEQIHAILLHEIGHVFGADHIEGTIMRADIAGRLAWYTKYCLDSSHSNSVASIICPRENNGFYYQLFHHRMILYWRDLAMIFHGELGKNKMNDYSTEKTFVDLFGQKPVGQVRAYLQGKNPDTMKLIVSDGTRYEKFSFKLDNLAESRIQVFGPGVGMAHFFEPSKLNPLTPSSTIITNNYGETYFGTIQALTGELPVVVQVNMPNTNFQEFGPVRIGYKSTPNSTQFETLFFSSQQYSFGFESWSH